MRVHSATEPIPPLRDLRRRPKGSGESPLRRKPSPPGPEREDPAPAIAARSEPSCPAHALPLPEKTPIPTAAEARLRFRRDWAPPQSDFHLKDRRV